MAPKTAAAKKAAEKAKFNERRSAKRQALAEAKRVKAEAEIRGDGASSDSSASVSCRLRARALIAAREAKRLFALSTAIAPDSCSSKSLKMEETQPPLANSSSSSSSGSVPVLAAPSRTREERLAALVAAIPGGLPTLGTAATNPVVLEEEVGSAWNMPAQTNEQK